MGLVPGSVRLLRSGALLRRAGTADHGRPRPRPAAGDRPGLPDGQPIGIADNFDGWPRYLWLDQGTYDLVFYHEGFQTIARQYSIYPGVIIDVEDRMVPGEAVPPEDLIAKSTAQP